MVVQASRCPVQPSFRPASTKEPHTHIRNETSPSQRPTCLSVEDMRVEPGCRTSDARQEIPIGHLCKLTRVLDESKPKNNKRCRQKTPRSKFRSKSRVNRTVAGSPGPLSLCHTAPHPLSMLSGSEVDMHRSCSGRL